MLKEPDRPVVGPWARDKLGRLSAYLQAFTTALKNQRFRRVYIDAFAGAGSAYLRSDDSEEDESVEWLFRRGEGDEQLDEQERQVLDGSPQIALKTDPPFDACVFMERDPDRLRQLEQLKAEHPGRDVRIYPGNCNDYFEDKLKAASADWRAWRGVVFLDPFGMHVPWTTIEWLARTQALEVIINFPLAMAIHRVLPRSPEQLSIRRCMRNDLYFGDCGWLDRAYRLDHGLFGHTMVKRDDAGERLLKWYSHRLKRAFGHVSPPYLVSNSRGAPLYHLIWAGPHRLGLKIAAHVLSQENAARRQLTLDSAARRGQP